MEAIPRVRATICPSQNRRERSRFDKSPSAFELRRRCGRGRRTICLLSDRRNEVQDTGMAGGGTLPPPRSGAPPFRLRSDFACPRFRENWGPLVLLGGLIAACTPPTFA